MGATPPCPTRTRRTHVPPLETGIMNPQLRRIRLLVTAAAVGVLAVPASAADVVSPQTQLINDELAKASKAGDLRPSKRASDYEFVRRAFIDIVGRIPTPEEVRDFAEADGSANKRARLIQRLLYEKEYKPKFAERTNPKDPKSVIAYDYASEYARHFTNIWSVWLMTRGGVAEVYQE